MAAADGETTVRIRMVNSDSVAVATFSTPGGRVEYRGDVAIAGVPGTAAPVVLAFTDTEGSATGSLLPTGSVRDVIDGVEVTCVDNGMPVVVARAEAFGLTGYESHETLAADTALLDRIDALRIQAGKLMGLGDVASSSVPKTTLLAPPRDGGRVSTRSFIPVRPHTAIGVLGAVERRHRDAARRRRRQRSRAAVAGGHVPGRRRAPDRAPARRRGRRRLGHAAARGAVGRRPHRPQAVRRHHLSPLRHRRPLMPPLHDVAHLAHVELRTPVPEASLEFFTRYLGLTENGSDGDSVFLRAWDDYENTTIKLTAHTTSGVGRTNLRASSPEALQRRVAAIEAAGRGVGWADGDPGYGPTYVFSDPDGHEFGLYYESEWYRPPAGLVPSLKNQAQAYPSHGVAVRRLDHINWLGVEPVDNRDFLRDELGALVTEQIVLDDGTIAGSWTTFTNKGYDAVYTRDRTGTAGRLHHIAFAVDSRDGILRAADIALEQGVHIETGPHKHAIQQTFFLYVYEPGGNRIELCNAGARLVLAPDWQPVDWTEAERAKGQAWGLKTIDSFHTHGTPPVRGQ